LTQTLSGANLPEAVYDNFLAAIGVERATPIAPLDLDDSKTPRTNYTIAVALGSGFVFTVQEEDIQWPRRTLSEDRTASCLAGTRI
jgi:hypothetical protein